MTINDHETSVAAKPGELELALQEAHAQRQRAAALFGAPDWDDEQDDDADE